MSTPFYLDYSNTNTSSNFNDNNTSNHHLNNKGSFSNNISYDQSHATYQKNQNTNYNIHLNNNISSNELSPLKMPLNYETFGNSNENLMSSMTNDYKSSNIGGWRQHQNYYQLPNDQHGSFHQQSSSYLID